MRAASVLLFLVCCASRVAHADTLEEVFRAATQASARGEDEAALARYGQLIDAGVVDADVFYDAGRAHAKLNHLGQAIRFYEKALALRPGDEEAARGLRAVSALVSRLRAHREGDRAAQDATSVGEAAVRGASEPALAWAVIALAACLFGSLSALHFLRREMPRLVVGVSAIVFGIGLTAAAAGLAVKRGAFRDGDPAIVVADEITLRDAPDPRAAEIGALYDGDRVSLVEREGGWVRVRGRSRDGWTRAQDIGGI